MSDQDRDEDPSSARERRSLLYQVGRATGKQFRKGSPGREMAKRVGSTVVRRGLWRFLR